MNDQMPILKNWSWNGRAMCGEVFSHPNPRFFNGETITTSTVINVYRKDDQLFAECKSRTYLLDGSDPGYEKAYPDAEERLVKTWTERIN